jgi:hypothetical protein
VRVFCSLDNQVLDVALVVTMHRCDELILNEHLQIDESLMRELLLLAQVHIELRLVGLLLLSELSCSTSLSLALVLCCSLTHCLLLLQHWLLVDGEFSESQVE